MDAEDGPATSGLIQALLSEPHLFSFFQVIQILENQRPHAARIGYQGPASEECLRLRPVLDMAFPPGDVQSIERVVDEYGRERFHVETAFLGLYGTMSPLPTFYTEELLHERDERSLVRGFLDLFHHRLISLFFRCWSKYRYHVQFRHGGTDEFSHKMFCVGGLGTVGPIRGEDVPRVRLLRYAGLLVGGICSQAALTAIISDYFDGIATEVTPCVPRWVLVPMEQRNHLGAANSVLGASVHVGERVRDRSSKYRVTLGRMGLARFLAFLPHTPDFRALGEIARLFVRDQLAWEVELILSREEIPDLRLTEDSPGALLGQTTWLGRPAADARVVLQEPRRAVPAPGGAETERAAA